MPDTRQNLNFGTGEGLSSAEIAKRMIAGGWRPVRIVPGQKRPVGKEWQTRTDKPDDFKPDEGAGALTGHGVGGLDIDVYCPETAEAIQQEAERRFGKGLVRIGLAPKSMLVYRMPEGMKKAEARIAPTGFAPEGKDEKVEVLGLGQQFVAFGIHPDTGKPYGWVGVEPWDNFLGRVEDLPEITEDGVRDFLAWVSQEYGEAKPKEQPKASNRTKPNGAQYEDADASVDEVLDLLSYIPADLYDVWLSVLMALHDRFGGSAEGMRIAEEWSATSAKYKPGDVDRKWSSFDGQGVRWATIPALARQNGADLSEISRKHNSGPKPNFRGAARERPPAGAAANDRVSIGAVKLDKNQQPAWCLSTAVALLEMADEWQDVLAFNEFIGEFIVCKPIPGSDPTGFVPHELSADDISATEIWFNRIFSRVTEMTIVKAIKTVAKKSVINPPKHYLEALKWDGVNRLQDWLITYLGAAKSDYTKAVGQSALIAAVARVFEPGCKAETVMILEGPQGIRKSSALRVLAGDEYFGDSIPDLKSKDAADYLRGLWIVELAELQAFNRNEMETIKSFLSRQDDVYRPAYERTRIKQKRRCVFIGSTNQDNYLRDETGSRRFWPVPVRKIHLEKLKADRDQIWAEAVTMYRAGTPWWLSAEMEAVAAQEQSKRSEDDPWTGAVLNHVLGRAEICIPDIMESCLNIDLAQKTRADSDRVARILKRDGWVRNGLMTSGSYKSQASYTKPANE